MKLPNTRKILVPIIIIIILIIAFIRTNPKNDEYVKKTGYAMGTYVSLTILDTKGMDSDKLLDDALESISDVESKMSSTINTSEVSNINKNAGIKPVKVSNETYTVIKSGIKYGTLTDGAFDITLGPLIRLWGISQPESETKHKVPSEEEILSDLSLVNYKDIETNDSKKTVFLKRKNMALDLGGIAKGYSVDSIEKTLKKSGVNSGIVDIGGDIYLIGSKSDNSNWSIGIKNPTTSKSKKPIGTVSLSNSSIVTSGTYERYFKSKGNIYHHILDTKNGYPVDNNLLSVTIVSKKSIDGDSLATGTLSLGVDKGLHLINTLNNVDAIFITKDKKVYTTKNLKNSFKVTDKSFTLID